MRRRKVGTGPCRARTQTHLLVKGQRNICGLLHIGLQLPRGLRIQTVLLRAAVQFQLGDEALNLKVEKRERGTSSLLCLYSSCVARDLLSLN